MTTTYYEFEIYIPDIKTWKAFPLLVKASLIKNYFDLTLKIKKYDEGFSMRSGNIILIIFF